MLAEPFFGKKTKQNKQTKNRLVGNDESVYVVCVCVCVYVSPVIFRIFFYC